MENNYVAYVKAVGNYDGSATGGAYIILKGNDTYKISSKAQVNTIAYKMELLTIVSVACSIPDGGSVVIFTNNKMLRSLNNLREIKDGANYPELKNYFWSRRSVWEGWTSYGVRRIMRTSCSTPLLTTPSRFSRSFAVRLILEINDVKILKL